MWLATVPLPTAVGPASTTRRESAAPRRAVGLVDRKSRRRSRWWAPSPPRRFDGEISSRSMRRRILVTPIEGMLTSNSVTRSLPSTPTGSLTAAASTSRAVRSPAATWALTAALARRAATAARDAATRSTSGGIGRFSATGRSCFSYSAHDRLDEPVGAGREHAARFTYDNASSVPAVQGFDIGDVGALVAEAGGEHRSERRRGRGGQIDPEVGQVEGRAQHDADRAQRPGRGGGVPFAHLVQNRAGDALTGPCSVGHDGALDGAG